MTESARSRNWLRWLILAILVAGFAGFYVLGLHEYFIFDQIRENAAHIKTYVDDNLLLAIVLFFLAYTAITALSLPVAVVMTLLGGALFDLWLGTGVVLLAATVGATIAFLSSRFLLRDWVQAKLGARLDAFNRGVETDGAFYLFSLRLVPLFPFWLINLAMGLTPIRTWTYFWVSLIGMLPGTVLYINVGKRLSELESARDLVSPMFVVSLALLGIAPLVFRWMLRWRQNGRRER
jgi:uncharacterized membrane protein YdjX (TVP38/TMEM64 family)